MNSGSTIRDDIDAIVDAWKRDGGAINTRLTLVARLTRYIEDKLGDASDRLRPVFDDGHRVGVGHERRRCLSITTAVAREIDDEVAARLAALAPGEEGDNGIAVGAVRACREAYRRIAGMSDGDVEKVKEAARGEVVACG